jgi:phosphoenolpyruvate-protein kinase (PTS system EI component)
VILARGLDVPAVVSAPLELGQIENSTLTVLDGGTGDVIVGPTLAELNRAKQRQAAWQLTHGVQLSSVHQPAVTLDGHRAEVAADIANLDDARKAIEQGAEGVGLFRTEFLYLDRDTMPSEEEQTATYRDVFRVMGTMPVVVRTLDMVGTSPLAT